MLKIAKLIMVAIDVKGGAAQSNKYYNMFEQPDGTFSVEYGRVNKTKINESYSMSLWDKKLKEKTKKGYEDVTRLFTEVIATAGPAATQADIANAVIKRLVDQLQAYAKKSVQANYSVSSESVTEKMVDEAQAVINDINVSLNPKSTAKEINDKLLKLYRIIPRQMANVKSHLVDDNFTYKANKDSLEKMMANEQATLDVMEGQVALNKAQQKSQNPGEVKKSMDMLEMLGLEMTEISAKEISDIKALMGPDSDKFLNAYKVVNRATQKRFDNYVSKAKDKTCKTFWHGSRNENIFSIVEKGLMIRPSGAVYSGSAFGDGIYFADKFKKSYGYTSGRGSYWAGGSSDRAFLFLFNVNVGKQLIVSHSDSGLSWKKIQAQGGYDSTYAKPSSSSYIANAEYIVYQSEQCTVQYIVEVKG